jgi:hypothetical protein
MPSLVAEIGDVLEHHLREIGILKTEETDKRQKQFIQDKAEEYNQKMSATKNDLGDFPETSELCDKCMTRAVIFLDGCLTCLNCGESKCG